MTNQIDFVYGQAICYSGFRDGQSPEIGVFPSYHEILEDLMILQGKWKYLRLYDCDQHSKTVLEVIRKEKLDFKVMLGAYIVAEVNNEGCPWGGMYEERQLIDNKKANQRKIDEVILLANEFKGIVFSLSAGNEATVDWTDHLVPVESVIDYVKQLQEQTNLPVTFCENYLPWLNKLKPLAEIGRAHV